MIEKFENGEIEYHLPNVIEGLRLANKIRAAIGEEAWTEELLLAETIQHMEPVIDKITHDDKEVGYIDLLKVKDAKFAIISVADNLIGEMFYTEQKKS
jgi:hypothetical protein